MQIRLTQDFVVYQAETKLLELGVEVATAKNWKKPEIEEKIQRGIKIRLWLKALLYSDYLEQDAIERLYYRLADLCDAIALPYAPVITTHEPPAITLGGTTNVTNNYSSDSTEFENTDVDTPSEVVDSFSAASARGAVWHYTIRNQAGTSQRSGIVVASWLADGTLVWNEESSGDIGTTIGTVTLSVVYTAPNITLVATVSSSNWVIEGDRFLING
jgi:hypothetical protein